jgi:hypothetical protein
MRPEKRAAKIGGLTMPTENQDFVFLNLIAINLEKLLSIQLDILNFPELGH